MKKLRTISHDFSHFRQGRWSLAALVLGFGGAQRRSPRPAAAVLRAYLSLALVAGLFLAPEPAQAQNATGAPLIYGDPRLGEVLRVQTTESSPISDPEGIANASFSYQWIRVDGGNETDINNATSATYTPTSDDVGKTIKVKVDFQDDANNAESLTSAIFPPRGLTILPATLPTTTCTAPMLTGRTQIWQGTLTVGVFAYAHQLEFGWFPRSGEEFSDTFGDIPSNQRDFSTGDNDYTLENRIKLSAHRSARLELRLSDRLTDDELASIGLHVMRQPFRLFQAWPGPISGH